MCRDSGVQLQALDSCIVASHVGIRSVSFIAGPFYNTLPLCLLSTPIVTTRLSLLIVVFVVIVVSFIIHSFTVPSFQVRAALIGGARRHVTIPSATQRTVLI